MTKYPATLEWSAAKNLGVGFDLDNLKGGSGFYEVDTPTNGPGTGVWFVTVQKSGIDGKVVHQAVKKDAPEKVHLRTFSGSAWTGWKLAGKVMSTAAPTAMTTSATIASADLLAGWVTSDQGAGAAATYTLPTGAIFDAAYLAAYPGAAVGDTIDFAIIVIGDNNLEDVTLDAAAGFTIVGNPVVQSTTQTENTSGLFRLRRAAADTWVAYRIA